LTAPLTAGWSGLTVSGGNLDSTTYGQGTSFPSTWNVTRLFWRTDTNRIYKNTGTEGTPVWSPSSIIPVGVSGDVLYHNGTDWTRLAKGTDGKFLKLSSGIPSWGEPLPYGNGSSSVTSISSGTLDTSIQYENLTISGTVTMGSGVLYVSDTLTITGTLSKNNIINGGSGGSAGAAQGGNGGSSASGIFGIGLGSSLLAGKIGGNGGYGSALVGGVGGGVNEKINASPIDIRFNNVKSILDGIPYGFNSSGSGGSGGGGGKGSSNGGAGGAGGAGGSSGGDIIIFAKNIVLSGTVQATGSNGVAGSAGFSFSTSTSDRSGGGGGGGGNGGGGGLIVMVYDSLSNSGSTDVTAGTGGAGGTAGTSSSDVTAATNGATGSSGSAGQVFTLSRV